LAGDAVREAIRDRRVNDAIPNEEDVGACGFSDQAAIIEHHRIRVALGFGGIRECRAGCPSVDAVGLCQN
jgi:hypothetical protein